MRQIGINQYVGEHPAIIESVIEIKEEQEKHIASNKKKFLAMTPARRFIHLANKYFRKPARYGYDKGHTFWQANDYTLIDIESCSNLQDIPDSYEFIIKLHTLYVVDLYRSQGYGRQALSKLIEICEESQCVMVLFSIPYGIGDETGPRGFTTFDDLWQAVCGEKLDNLDLADYEGDLREFFYKQNGLVNFCLYNDDIFERNIEDVIPFTRQMAYIPKSIDNTNLDKLQYRLNHDLCKWSRR